MRQGRCVSRCSARPGAVSDCRALGGGSWGRSRRLLEGLRGQRRWHREGREPATPRACDIRRRAEGCVKELRGEWRERKEA